MKSAPFLLCLICALAAGPAAAQQPVAALLRLTLNGEAAGSSVVTSYGAENSLFAALGESALETVDLTPLHSDFQRLRYSNDCALTGANSLASCSDFGSYEQAVLSVLEDLSWGVNADVPELARLADGGLVLICEVRVSLNEADGAVAAEFGGRMFDVLAQGPATQMERATFDNFTDDPNMIEAVISEVVDEVIYRGVEALNSQSG